MWWLYGRTSGIFSKMGLTTCFHFKVEFIKIGTTRWFFLCLRSLKEEVGVVGWIKVFSNDCCCCLCDRLVMVSDICSYGWLPYCIDGGVLIQKCVNRGRLCVKIGEEEAPILLCLYIPLQCKYIWLLYATCSSFVYLSWVCVKIMKG